MRPFIVSLAAAFAAGAASHVPLVWRRANGPPGSRALTAVAIEAGSSRVAVGGEGGAWLEEATGRWRRIRTRGAVRDLAFAPDGALWAATERGLLRLEGDATVDRTPAPGEAAADVVRVAVGPRGAIAAATAAGVFWASNLAAEPESAGSPALRWRRVAGVLGAEPAQGLAIGQEASSRVLWIASARGLFRLQPDEASANRTLRAERVAWPRDGDPILDLAVEPSGRFVALGRRSLFVRAPGGAWRKLAIALPPGAVAQRVGRGAGRLWIATDRGLVEAQVPEGPWRRAGPPVGSEPVAALAGDAVRVFAAGARGLLIGGAARGEAVQAHVPAAECEPSPLVVQRAALAYLELEPARVARLRNAVRRRAWLPKVNVKGGVDHDRSAGWGNDERFVSGGLHPQHSRNGDTSRGYSLDLSLTWDLDALVFDPDELDVSDEARRLVALRDEVLDEVNQLYFDRRRANAALRSSRPGSPDATRLRLHAEELAAGLDAWTGGWFTQRLSAMRAGAACAPRSGRSVPSHP